MPRNTVLVRLPDGTYELMDLPIEAQLPAHRQPQQISPRYADDYRQYPQRYEPPRRRRKRERVSPRTVVFTLFVLSWGWCGVGLPGLTLLTWAVAGIYAVRNLKS